ncbi:MAG: LpqB family beta-propeller domain-containing protein [Gemmatimonadales bacterium]
MNPYAAVFVTMALCTAPLWSQAATNGLVETGQETDPSHPLFGSGSATHPALSPNGRKLAFMSNSQGVVEGNPINFEIYVANSDGSDPVRLTHNDAFDADIAWSPDGQFLAFKSYRDGNDEIYVMTADGSDQHNLTRRSSAEHAPHWSPDGTTIAFNSDRNGNGGIFLMNADGGEVVQLTTSQYSESSPRFSPDGQRIAFVSNRAGNDDIFVMNRDGSGMRQLTTGADSDWYPRWSPDGSELLFISGSFADDRFDLYTVSVDGSATPELLLRGVDSGNASWDTSGNCIYVGRYVDGESRLFVMRRDGTVLRPLAVSAQDHHASRNGQDDA